MHWQVHPVLCQPHCREQNQSRQKFWPKQKDMTKLHKEVFMSNFHMPLKKKELFGFDTKDRKKTCVQLSRSLLSQPKRHSSSSKLEKERVTIAGYHTEHASSTLRSTSRNVTSWKPLLSVRVITHSSSLCSTVQIMEKIPFFVLCGRGHFVFQQEFTQPCGCPADLRFLQLPAPTAVADPRERPSPLAPKIFLSCNFQAISRGNSLF